MTHIQIRLARPTPDGRWAPATGNVEWTPTRRFNVDAATVLPAPFMAPLPGGEPVADPGDLPVVVVEVEPTGPAWCWRVTERTPLGGERFVAVPASAEAVPYVGLIDVDPTTLEPATPAVPAWTAATALIQGYRDDILAVLPLIEPIPGAAEAIRQDALTAISAAEDAHTDSISAGQHRAAAESAASTAASEVRADLANIIDIDYDPAIGWIITRGD